ncbi:alkaline phosphatase family protein [Halorarum salinum]|uniref:Alkaline phosphatase family protein n=1 Tax=Halorarum salinum TaxID=2743089 RepID=A0A7D5LD65_9EURY|nr:nucleotide pyrophosphatase/phosphodiesterase family protein [Halobaculum salinum]QLG64206.1 alkaline phosphatase family protein [Halobaculum salinum]
MAEPPGAAGGPGSSETSEPTAGRVVVLDVVGLQPEHVSADRTPELDAALEEVIPSEPAFPALTVPAQTTLATGRSPAEHGDVSSGEYDRERDAAAFWERDRGGRDRIWETAREAGLTTGALFFQHLIGTDADVAVTPSPIEDEDNNMLEMNCWTNPDGLYDDLRAEYGHFPLHNYWGPTANEESSRWILSAASEAVERFDPDLLWVYVPHLDYAGLRHGPGPELEAELPVVDELVGGFLATLRGDDRWDETAVAVVGEYGFHGVDTPVLPNVALREAGLLETESADGGSAGSTEVDLPGSDAFAMVDHQVAHVYADGDAVEEARELLASLDGVDVVLDGGGSGGPDKAAYGVDHPNAGDLVLVAEPSAWFAYYWWTDRAEAPPYAAEMDIHAKPGFDPCELFLGEEGLVSLDPSKVGGSHGRTDPGTYPAFGLGGPAVSGVELGEGTGSEGAVDARAIAPTIAALLGVADAVDAEVPPLVGDETEGSRG